MRKKKKMMKFLLTSKKCWLMEDNLIPFYQHLVDDYSKLREEWTVKVEETDIETIPQVKEEPEDDYLLDYQPVNLNNSTNRFKVIFSLSLLGDNLMNS